MSAKKRLNATYIRRRAFVLMNLSPERSGAIVIVDDDPFVGALLHRLLQDIASERDIIIAKRGADALLQFEIRRVTLVITDYVMLDMDGIAVTRAVKERSPHTKVLAMTGISSNEVYESFIAAGADFFLSKPMRVSDVRDVLHQVFTSEHNVTKCEES